MELKAGYKLTEVGVIPEDWEVKSIGELSNVGSGGTPSRKNLAYWGGSIPWVTTSQIDFGIINSADQFISEFGLQNSAAKILPKGTLLLALYGQGKTRGKVAMLGLDATTNQACASIAVSGYISKEFLLHYLISQYEILRSASNTGSQENLNGKIVKEFPVLCPPLAEQHAIATALSDVDALLAKLDQLIAKKQSLKQAAMQQLLTGQTRLPGFSGEWEVKRLGDLAETSSGGTPPSSVAAYYDGDIPWVSIADMTSGGKVIFTTDRSLTAAGFQNSAAQMFPAGTVLYAMYASIGECSIAGVPLCSSQAILGIRTKPMLDKDFLFYFLTSLKPIIKSMGQQGTQANLNAGMVRAFELRLPNLAEQTAIAAVLSDMDAELTALQARRDKTRAIKQGMMQALLTGRIRLV